MLYRIFWCVILITYSCFVSAEAEQIQKFPGKLVISPNLFNVEIGSKPINESLLVSNAGNETINLKVYARSWELDENSEVVETPTTDQSLERWMVINPTQFELEPGATQVVRFSIRPKIQLAAGEHRSMLYIEEMVPEHIEEQAGINLVGIFGVAVYGQVGKAVRSGVLHDISYFDDENGFGITADIESTGNANVRFDGNYVIVKQSDYDAHAKKIISKIKKFAEGETEDNIKDITELDEMIISGGSVARLPVLPQTRRTIPMYLEKPKQAGSFFIVVVGTLGENKKNNAIQKIIPFTVNDISNNAEQQAVSYHIVAPMIN